MHHTAVLLLVFRAQKVKSSSSLACARLCVCRPPVCLSLVTIIVLGRLCIPLGIRKVKCPSKYVFRGLIHFNVFDLSTAASSRQEFTTRPSRTHSSHLSRVCSCSVPPRGTTANSSTSRTSRARNAGQVVKNASMLFFFFDAVRVRSFSVHNPGISKHPPHSPVFSHPCSAHALFSLWRVVR